MEAKLLIALSLAGALLTVGAVKLLSPWENLTRKMPVLATLSQSRVRLIAILEILAAVGLAVPVLAGIFPFLLPVTAAAVSALLLGAIAVHLRRREFPQSLPASAMLACALYLLATSIP